MKLIIFFTRTPASVSHHLPSLHLCPHQRPWPIHSRPHRITFADLFAEPYYRSIHFFRPLLHWMLHQYMALGNHLGPGSVLQSCVARRSRPKLDQTVCVRPAGARSHHHHLWLCVSWSSGSSRRPRLSSIGPNVWRGGRIRRRTSADDSSAQLSLPDGRDRLGRLGSRHNARTVVFRRQSRTFWTACDFPQRLTSLRRPPRCRSPHRSAQDLPLSLCNFSTVIGKYSAGS